MSAFGGCWVRAAPNFSVPDLVPPPAIAADRLDDRRKLLEGVDRFHRAAEAKANKAAGAVGTVRDKAFNVVFEEPRENAERR